MLLGAIGGPKWSAPHAKVRPEAACCACARELGVYANLRPVAVHPALRDASTLKAGGPARRGPGVRARADRWHLLRRRRRRIGDRRPATCAATRSWRSSASRASPAGWRAARRRKTRFRSTSPTCSRPRACGASGQRRVMQTEFPECRGAHAGRCGGHAPDPPATRLRRDRHREHVRRHPHRRGVDAGRFARACCRRPRWATASAACTSPSTAPRPTSPARASPIPCGTILSAALLLRHSLGLEAEARAIEAAVEAAIAGGARTADIVERGGTAIGTVAMGDAVLAQLKKG